jgi:hypothetical protein
MPKTFTAVLISILVLIVIAFFVWQRVFRDSEKSVASDLPVAEISGSALLKAFTENEDSANSMFLGKVIVVTGHVYDISEDSTSVSVYLKEDADMAGVYCIFNKPVQLPATLTTGADVSIKGECSGYLLDVILNRCVFDL